MGARVFRCSGRASALASIWMAVPVSWQTPASGQTQSRVALDYEMGLDVEDCPSRAEFERDVQRQLGYDPFHRDAPRHLIARTSPTPSGLQGSVLWQDEDGRQRGERQLDVNHRDCRELVRSMAFAVVVQLQLLDTGPSPEPVEQPPPRSPPEPPPPPPPPPPEPETTTVQLHATTDEERGGWHMNLGLGPAVAAGLGPNPSLLARVFVAVRYEKYSLELGGAGSLPSTWRADDGRGFESRALMATVAPCFHHARLSGCAVAHLGQLRVQGVGLDEPSTPSGLLSQAGIRLGASQPVGPVLATLHVEGLAALTQWTVLVNESSVWSMPGASFRVGLDFGFPLQLSAAED